MRTSVDVHNYLVERDVRHEVFSVRGRFRTPERLAAVLELPPEQVGRVILYESDAGPVVALVASHRAPDAALVKKAARVGELAEVSPARASELSDYVSGAIPPVALPPEFVVVMDRALAGEDVLYFPAGDSNAVLKVRGEDLARAAEAKVVDLV